MLKDRIAKAVSRLWTGRCNIINYTSSEDENGITTTVKNIVAENVPCRVSYETLKQAEQTSTTADISQQIKLFISNDICVRVGSVVVVTQNGVTREYESSGLASVYTAHQEIMLVDKEVYA